MRTGVRSPRCADAVEDAEAVETGEHEVEDDEVVAVAFGEVGSGAAVRGAVDGESGALAEGRGDVFGESYLVFDEKSAHKDISLIAANYP